MSSPYREEDYVGDTTKRGTGSVTHHYGSCSLMTALNTLAVVVALSLAGSNTATAAPNTPSDMPVSPLF